MWDTSEACLVKLEAPTLSNTKSGTWARVKKKKKKEKRNHIHTHTFWVFLSAVVNPPTNVQQASLSMGLFKQTYLTLRMGGCLIEYIQNT